LDTNSGVFPWGTRQRPRSGRGAEYCSRFTPIPYPRGRKSVQLKCRPTNVNTTSQRHTSNTSLLIRVNAPARHGSGGLTGSNRAWCPSSHSVLQIHFAHHEQTRPAHFVTREKVGRTIFLRQGDMLILKEVRDTFTSNNAVFLLDLLLRFVFMFAHKLFWLIETDTSTICMKVYRKTPQAEKVAHFVAIRRKERF
jgi:hypothetical protein